MAHKASSSIAPSLASRIRRPLRTSLLRPQLAISSSLVHPRLDLPGSRSRYPCPQPPLVARDWGCGVGPGGAIRTTRTRVCADLTNVIVPLVFSTFGVVFIAELPDKTALASLVLASSYPARQVVVGAWLAFLVQTAVAVVAGSALALLPRLW